MIDLQINTAQIPEQMEDLKIAALMAALIIGFSVIACLVIFAGAVILVTRWWVGDDHLPSAIFGATCCRMVGCQASGARFSGIDGPSVAKLIPWPQL